MQLFLQQIVEGLASGAIYASLALALVLVYRATRDRGAKVTGATPEIEALLEQVAEADEPVQVKPDERGGVVGLVSEIGEWVEETGTTLKGLLGFFGATLIGFYQIAKRPAKRFRLNAVVQRFDLVGVRAEPRPDPTLARSRDLPHLVGDSTKLRRATGWTPTISLDQTLRGLVDAEAH